jgi:hypothetical protein
VQLERQHQLQGQQLVLEQQRQQLVLEQLLGQPQQELEQQVLQLLLFCRKQTEQQQR